jgi:hypothetical protein
VAVRRGSAKASLANTLPAPAVCANAPSNTRRPLSSLFMPSSMKLRTKRPLWEMPNMSAWWGLALSPSLPIAGFMVPLVSMRS